MHIYYGIHHKKVNNSEQEIYYIQLEGWISVVAWWCLFDQSGYEATPSVTFFGTIFFFFHTEKDFFLLLSTSSLTINV